MPSSECEGFGIRRPKVGRAPRRKDLKLYAHSTGVAVRVRPDAILFFFFVVPELQCRFYETIGAK